MNAGKQTATGPVVEPAVRVAARNVDARANLARLVPLDGEPMSRVFAADPDPIAHAPRAHLGQPDQTDASDRKALE
jgi:hypothetical protein